MVEDIKDIAIYMNEHMYKSIKFILFNSIVLYGLYTITNIISHSVVAGSTF